MKCFKEYSMFLHNYHLCWKKIAFFKEYHKSFIRLSYNLYQYHIFHKMMVAFIRVLDISNIIMWFKRLLYDAYKYHMFSRLSYVLKDFNNRIVCLIRL